MRDVARLLGVRHGSVYRQDPELFATFRVLATEHSTSRPASPRRWRAPS